MRKCRCGKPLTPAGECKSPRHDLTLARRHDPAVIAQIRDGSIEETAEMFGVSTQAVERWRGDMGLDKRLIRQRNFTPESLERVRVLAKDGVPPVWIAEEFDVSADMIRRLMWDMGYEVDPDWASVQLEARKDKSLARLHTLFQPKRASAKR